MNTFSTVLGKIPVDDLGVTLAHEHICCYLEYFWMMAGTKYLDKQRLEQVAVKSLDYMKKTYGLNTLIDCTPINIGRDIELLKRVSASTGVNIIASSGFYYTEEIMLRRNQVEDIAEYIVEDARNIGAGMLKFGLETETMSALMEKMFTAMCIAQKELNIPLCVHTNVHSKNALMAARFALDNGVEPQALTIAHLSDYPDAGYVEEVMKTGCYAGFDRIYRKDREYAERVARRIYSLCEKGYENKILLAHDNPIFSGFSEMPEIREFNTFEFIFSTLLPIMEDMGMDTKGFMIDNPKNMLMML